MPLDAEHPDVLVRGRSRRARSPRPGRRRSIRSRAGRRPRRSTPWWWCDEHARTPTPAVASSRLPGAGFTSCVETVSATGTPCSNSPGMSGRCWWSVPPNATFITCMPATDRERREAEAVGGEQQVDLELVAVGLDAVGVLHRRVSAVARGVDVAAPHQHQPVERGQDLVGVVRLARADDQDARAGTSERVDVRARDAVPAVRPSRHSAGCQVVTDDGDQRTVGLAHQAVSCTTPAKREDGSQPAFWLVARDASASARRSSFDFPQPVASRSTASHRTNGIGFTQRVYGECFLSSHATV